MESTEVMEKTNSTFELRPAEDNKKPEMLEVINKNELKEENSDSKKAELTDQQSEICEKPASGNLKAGLEEQTLECIPKLSSLSEKQEKYLDRLLELESSNEQGWEEVHKSDYIKILKTSKADSPVVLIKVYVHLPEIPADKVYRMISDVEIRSKWDNVLSKLHVFGKVNEHVDHMYSLYKAPIGISDRDFCQRRIRASNYKEVPFIIHFKSVNHADCPPKGGVIRAHTHISGYIIRHSKRGSGCTDMTILTQTDIKGKVPTFIVNLAAAKAPSSWCSNFKESANRLIKEGRI
jgi:hypothetical protein